MRYSIIVPSYNHLEDCLKPCINSVLANTDLLEGDGELVIVLNGCTDESSIWCKGIAERFGVRVKVLESVEALGYTRATNWGIRESSGEYIILLNNDVEILDCFTKNYWIDKLIGSFKDKRVGVTGITKVWDKNSGWDFIIFFCACLRRDLINAYGLLDEIYSPGGCEDIEYCIRLQKKGYTVVGLGKDKAIWEYGAEYPIWHKGEQTVWGLSNWNSIWDRNIKIVSSYRDKVRYSIYVDGVSEDQLLGRLDSVRRNTSFNDKEIVFSNRFSSLYEKVKEYGPYRLCEYNDWKFADIGIHVYLNGRVIDSGIDVWLSDIDRGVGLLYDNGCNKLGFYNRKNRESVQLGTLWWIGERYNNFYSRDIRLKTVDSKYIEFDD